MDLVLYVGERELDKPEGLPLYRARTVNEALGMYIHFMPDAIILDGSSVVARLVFEHLADVTAGSPHGLDALLVVNAGDCVWQAPEGAILRQVSGWPSVDGLARLLDGLDTARRQVRFEQSVRKDERLPSLY